MGRIAMRPCESRGNPRLATTRDGGRGMADKTRCSWPGVDPLMIAYHDQEWGTPLRDDRKLFEFLILEGAQAGLSWQTILRKREGYRRAFVDFEPARVAGYGDRDVARLLANPEIVRNRQKVNAAIGNARALLDLERTGDNFSGFIWSFVGNQPINNNRTDIKEVPSTSPESEAMSRALRRRGFRFVGPTICYAFMQAAGLVNDHLVSCFRHQEISSLY